LIESEVGFALIVPGGGGVGVAVDDEVGEEDGEPPGLAVTYT
jgi:hypothetical protein